MYFGCMHSSNITAQPKEFCTKLELSFCIKLNLSVLILDADLETVYQEEDKSRFVMVLLLYGANHCPQL